MCQDQESNPQPLSVWDDAPTNWLGISCSLKSGSVITPDFFPPLNCFGSMGSLGISYIFENFWSISVKNAIGILIGIALNLYIPFGNMDILTVFSLPVHEFGIFFHFLCL